MWILGLTVAFIATIYFGYLLFAVQRMGKRIRAHRRSELIQFPVVEQQLAVPIETVAMETVVIVVRPQVALPPIQMFPLLPGYMATVIMRRIRQQVIWSQAVDRQAQLAQLTTFCDLSRPIPLKVALLYCKAEDKVVLAAIVKQEPGYLQFADKLGIKVWRNQLGQISMKATI